MRTGYLIKDKQERFNMKRGYFVNAWRIVNDKKQDIIQPWFNTKTEARNCAKQLNINLIEKHSL